MASYDRQFEIVIPSDLSLIVRKPLKVADPQLLNPQSISPVPLIDGEFVQINTVYQWIRATSTTQLAYATFEDRGDYGVQASGKLAALFSGGYEADTIVFNTGLTTLGAPLMNGDVTVGGATRRGLIAHTGSNLVIGYVTRTAATNGGRLRFQQTLV